MGLIVIISVMAFGVLMVIEMIQISEEGWYVHGDVADVFMNIPRDKLRKSDGYRNVISIMKNNKNRRSEDIDIKKAGMPIFCKYCIDGYGMVLRFTRLHKEIEGMVTYMKRGDLTEAEKLRKDLNL